MPDPPAGKAGSGHPSQATRGIWRIEFAAAASSGQGISTPLRSLYPAYPMCAEPTLAPKCGPSDQSRGPYGPASLENNPWRINRDLPLSAVDRHNAIASGTRKIRTDNRPRVRSNQRQTNNPRRRTTGRSTVTLEGVRNLAISVSNRPGKDSHPARARRRAVRTRAETLPAGARTSRGDRAATRKRLSASNRSCRRTSGEPVGVNNPRREDVRPAASKRRPNRKGARCARSRSAGWVKSART